MDFTYAAGKVGALMGKLLDPAQVSTLLSQKQLKSFIYELEKTQYKQPMEKFTPLNSEGIELALLHYFDSKILDKVKNALPDKLKVLVDRLFRDKFFYTMLTVALASKRYGNKVELPEFEGINYIPIRAVEECSDLPAALNYLKKNNFIKSAEAPFEEIVVELNRKYYLDLWDFVNKLPFGRERRVLRRLIGERVELENIAMCARLMDIDDIEYKRKQIVPIDYQLTPGDYTFLFNCKKPEEFLKLGIYTVDIQKAVEKHKEGVPEAFEHVFRKSLLKLYTDMVYHSSFKLEFVLGYLSLQWYEISKLRQAALYIDNQMEIKNVSGAF
jgi:vacuolar-type H+-ATPase subunit C/Vma6